MAGAKSGSPRRAHESGADHLIFAPTRKSAKRKPAAKRGVGGLHEDTATRNVNKVPDQSP
jgi:hypothetical protein